MQQSCRNQNLRNMSGRSPVSSASAVHKFDHGNHRFPISLKIPRQAALHTFEHQVLKHVPVIMDRNAPFSIMIDSVGLVHTSPYAISHYLLPPITELFSDPFQAVIAVAQPVIEAPSDSTRIIHHSFQSLGKQLVQPFVI